MGTPTHFLVTPDLRQKGACNQGKEAFRAESMQSGATCPLCCYWRWLGLRGYTPYKAQSTLCVSLLNSKTKKKAPVIGFSVPFCVEHSKGFVSALCDQSK